jgi:hypothetical protein
VAFAIKAQIDDPRAETYTFTAAKTMYGGRQIRVGDVVFLFASENEGGHGMIAAGIVTRARAIAKDGAVARQTPRVSVSARRIAVALRPLGRQELKNFTDYEGSQPQAELNFKLYRQATNKIIGISDRTAVFLKSFFSAAANWP